MHSSIKKINYYLKKNGVTVYTFTDDRKAFIEAALLKQRCPHDVIELAMSNLYEIMNPPFFSKSFWCEKKRREVIADSDAMVTDLVTQTAPGTNPWINTTSFSTPVYYADATTPKVQVYHVKYVSGVPVRQTNSNFEKDMKSVPIHPSWVPAAGSDEHITIIDYASNKLWEFWKFKRINGKCEAGWGGMIPDLSNSNGVVPKVGGELRGATATSLPLIGGTILFDELESDVIPHELCFSLRRPKWDFIAPALRTDGDKGEANGIIPAGQAFQLPEDFKIPLDCVPLERMIYRCLIDYGMRQRDRSGNFCFYIEDISQRGLGGEPYKAFLGGKPVWEIMARITSRFNQLKAVSF